MPFRLKNAHTVYQRLMNQVLQKSCYCVFCYLGDIIIIIIACSFPELIERLKEVLKALITTNLICQFNAK